MELLRTITVMTANELAKKLHEVHGGIHNKAVEGTEFERLSINWLSAHSKTREITHKLAEWILENFDPKESPSND